MPCGGFVGASIARPSVCCFGIGPTDYRPAQVGVSFKSAVAAVARAATGCSFAPRQRNQSAQGFALDPRGWRPRPTAIWRAAQAVHFFHRRAPRSTRWPFHQSITLPYALLWLPKNPPAKEPLPAAGKLLRSFRTCPRPQHASFSGQPPDGLIRNFIWIRLRAGLAPGMIIAGLYKWGSRLTPGLARAVAALRVRPGSGGRPADILPERYPRQAGSWPSGWQGWPRRPSQIPGCRPFLPPDT